MKDKGVFLVTNLKEEKKMSIKLNESQVMACNLLATGMTHKKWPFKTK